MRLFALNTLENTPAAPAPSIPAALLETDGYKLTMNTEPKMSTPSGLGVLIQMISPEEITARLNEMAGLDGYMASKLYYRLAKLGGRELYPMGVALGITLALDDATEGLPPMIFMMLRMSYPQIVAAIVLDESLHAEILEALNA